MLGFGRPLSGPRGRDFMPAWSLTAFTQALLPGTAPWSVSNWSLLVSGISAISGIALCTYETYVLIFYVDSDQGTIFCRESSDNGQTFGAAVTAVSSGSTVIHLAAATGGNGLVALFFGAGNYIYVARREQGQWGLPIQWSNGYIGCTGLAACYALDWNLLVGGGNSSEGFAVWQCIYGDGFAQPAGTRSDLTIIQRSSGGLNVEFHFPSLIYADTVRLAFEERFLGSGSYSRSYLSSTPPGVEFSSALWREPAPFDCSTSTICG